MTNSIQKRARSSGFIGWSRCSIESLCIFIL
uniref:Uncharacterized protein n=1 Tax=Anguilla anguilla TaxID=7936 RepID=A0A0E9XAU9_ANGAN